jgi:hypothetical protein
MAASPAGAIAARGQRVRLHGPRNDPAAAAGNCSRQGAKITKKKNSDLSSSI